MSGHTPGPWEVDSESSNDGEAEVVVAADRTICWTADTFSDEEGAVITDEDRANGRLIAAAPELLASCKEMLASDGLIGNQPSVLRAVQSMREAINKAEGRGE
jgi:hypothetical protein